MIKATKDIIGCLVRHGDTSLGTVVSYDIDPTFGPTNKVLWNDGLERNYFCFLSDTTPKDINNDNVILLQLH